MATNSERSVDQPQMFARNPFTLADVETALYAAEIDRMAHAWGMTPHEAVAWQNEQDLVTRQPTTISAGARAAGVQLSIQHRIGRCAIPQP